MNLHPSCSSAATRSTAARARRRRQLTTIAANRSISPPRLRPLAGIERDALGVLAHAHQGKAEVGLGLLLAELDAGQWIADPMGQGRAEDGIQDRHEEQVARDGDAQDRDGA